MAMLSHMRRQVFVNVICMNEGAIHNWHGFQHILQRLSKIVGILQLHILIQNDVDLAQQFIASVVSLLLSQCCQCATASGIPGIRKNQALDLT